MRISYWLTIGSLALALQSPLLGGEKRAADAKKQERQAAFVKTMDAFAKAEGLIGSIEPSYVCQNGTEVCGSVNGNLEQVLSKRPDFLPDKYNFHRAHPGAT